MNFGTSLCDTCEGLRAGPGVVATCFEVKVCNFENVRDTVTPRHLRVIENLLGTPKDS